MKTLILGSTGFIGSELVKKISREQEITIFIRKNNSEVTSDFEVIDGELQSHETLQRFRKGKYTRVIDLSWIGLPNLTKQNNELNLSNKRNFIQTISDMDATEYVGFGSCLEYGSLTGSISEIQEGKNVGEFGRTKLAILESLKNSNLKFIWFRPFYLVGAKQHQNSLIKTAIDRFNSGLQFSPKDPNKTFDFIAISEAVEAINMVLENPKASGVYNIGSGERFSVNEVVNIVRESFGLMPEEFHLSDALVADTHKLKKDTGWIRKKEFRESVTEIVREIRST